MGRRSSILFFLVGGFSPYPDGDAALCVLGGRSSPRVLFFLLFFSFFLLGLPICWLAVFFSAVWYNYD